MTRDVVSTVCVGLALLFASVFALDASHRVCSLM
jgi:hypothetical protein